MTRRNFLKMIGLSATVLLLPISQQVKVIRKTTKVLINSSKNVKSVVKLGVGHYEIIFNNDDLTEETFVNFKG